MTGGARHVYVHVPFCARRCSYCDFAIAVRKSVPAEQFARTLRSELTTRLGTDVEPQPIDTLYLGGGTPSHLGADGITKTLDVLREFFVWHADAEVTLEANPDDVTAAAAAAWRAAGISRVSLGAQSFDPRALEWMHRSHSADQIDQAIEVIRDTPFASWSFDLIFALPASLGREWSRDIALALEKAPPHLSLYGLTVESGTPLAKWSARGDVLPADESAYEFEFLDAHDRAAAHGFEHYEVSNFAAPGHRARHNQSYWTGVPYLGFGPSAHGFDGASRRWNRSAYADWQRHVEAGDDPIDGSEILSDAERTTEAVYLGLRTTRGLTVGPAEIAVARPWIDAGWAILMQNHLTLTPAGWLRLDSLAAALTPVTTHT